MRAVILLRMVGLVFVYGTTPMPPPIVSVADFGCAETLEKLRSNGGGTMLVPSGEWKCPSLNLTSHLTIYLEAGATIKADSHTDWPLIDPLSNYGVGAGPVSRTRNTVDGPRWAPFLYGYNVTNLTIGGENGTIDGSGEYWWRRVWLGTEQHTRPSLFECVHCDDIILEDTTFKNSGFWTIHPVLSRGIIARRLTVLGQQWSLFPPALGSPNTDGFDPDSCSDVLLEDSYFAVDDDAVAIKAGWDCAGWGTPSNNITIRNLTVWHGGGGISIGSEMSGGVSNVLIEDILLQHGSYGLFIKTGGRDVTRGGFVQNVTMRNVEIIGAQKSAVSILADYGATNPYCSEPKRMPTHVRNITFMNVTSRGALNSSLMLVGSADAPTLDITLANVTFEQSPFKYYCGGSVSGVAVDVSPKLPSQCGLS